MKLKDSKFTEVKNIIFDFGNVLIDIDISLTIKAFEQIGLAGFNPEHIHPHNAGIFLDLEIGKISNEQFIAQLKEFVPERKLSDVELYYAWNMLLLPYDFKRFELLDKLRENYNIYLLSNTNLPHRDYFIQKFNAENPHNRTFESYFDKCFYSDAMQLRKPDVRIYEQTLLQAGINAQQTLFIDDNACNLPPAADIGLHTYHLCAPETVFDLFV